jgi:hypothetical protein
MPRTRKDNLERAVTDIHKAKKMLAAARRRLAKATYVDSPDVIVDPSLRGAAAALKKKAPSLSAIPGVHGYAVGQVVRKGMPSGDLCITVFVEQKIPKEELSRKSLAAIPRWITVDKKRYRIDVVPIGRLVLHARVGASVGTATTSPASEGTVGAFGTDDATGKAIAITAMHVSNLKEFPNGGPAVEFCTPSRLRSGTTAVLGKLTFGTTTGIDAAKIELQDGSSAENSIPGIGDVFGWRPVTIPGDNNAAVRMFGAATGKVSRGVIVHPSVSLPNFGLDTAILADIPTKGGDSGAGLVDANNHLLGFLVGEATGVDDQFPSLRVFTPVGSVLNILKCDIR